MTLKYRAGTLAPPWRSFRRATSPASRPCSCGRCRWCCFCGHCSLARLPVCCRSSGKAVSPVPAEVRTLKPASTQFPVTTPGSLVPGR